MTQKICQVTVESRSPLLIGDESGVGNYEQTTDYVPGSVLRGAVAKRLLGALPDDYAYDRNHASCPPEKTPAFWHVFGSNYPPLFRNAYPARGIGMPYPFPATARECKEHPGYESEKNPDGHGVFDTLIEQVVYDLCSDVPFRKEQGLLPRLGSGWLKLEKCYVPRCSLCGERVKPAEGYYLMDGSHCVPTSSPRVARATHVGINRARGVAEDALLFTLETIDNEGQLFRGQLVYDDVYAADLEKALLLDGRPTAFAIGRGRSRGMGDVEVKVQSYAPKEDMEDRLENFNEAFLDALHPYYRLNGLGGPQLDGYVFSLTLCAPAVLSNPLGLPVLWPDLAFAQLEMAQHIRAWARTTVVGGWDAAAGLPRRTCQAVEAGAVFLYYVSKEAISNIDALVTRLEMIELQGLGILRERGYGQVLICAPFHYAS